jgi:hypothetical protein
MPAFDTKAAVQKITLSNYQAAQEWSVLMEVAFQINVFFWLEFVDNQPDGD